MAMLCSSPMLHNPSVESYLQTAEGKSRFASLKDAPRRSVNYFGNKLADAGEFPGIFPAELDEDVSYFGLWDGKVEMCILFAKASEGVVQNNFLYKMDRNVMSGKGLFLLIAASALAAERKFPENTRLSFYIENNTTKKILDKIFPEAERREEAVRFELTFADVASALAEERFTSDLQLDMVINENMVCKNCVHCEESILSCGIYDQKPDRVLDGGDCAYFER